MTGGNRPLAGHRVLDLAQVYAGPTCSRVLCDLGAEVLKVEGLNRVDITRNFVIYDNESQNDYWNRAHYFLLRNAGKKSLTLDFSDPRSIDLLKRLVAECDIVTESFTPRVMAQHGLDYESLTKIRPDVILISMSGYGQTGPWRDYTAYGMSLEPASGISSFTGYRGGDPLRSGISFTDPYSGLVGAGAVLAALHYRRRTGKGQHIDLSEQEVAVPIGGYAILDRAMNGRDPERIGNRSPWYAPQGCYPCRGDDDWLVLTVRDDADWRAFCEATGHADWAADERFATLEGRRAHHDELDERIASWTRDQEHIEAMHHLQAAGVIAAAVLNPKEVLFDPHLRQRAYFDMVEHQGAPRPVPKQLGARFSAFDNSARGPAPSLGEHNREVLQGLLGLSDEELADLQEAGAIGDTPNFAVPIQTMQAAVQWPLTTFQQMGCVQAVDEDYKRQLGY